MTYSQIPKCQGKTSIKWVNLPMAKQHAMIDTLRKLDIHMIQLES